MRFTIEGDIKAAFDKVSKPCLLEILAEKIKDKKFITLMKQRLDYIYWDTDAKKYTEEQEGVPQGGIWYRTLHTYGISIC